VQQQDIEEEETLSKQKDKQAEEAVRKQKTLVEEYKRKQKEECREQHMQWEQAKGRQGALNKETQRQEACPGEVERKIEALEDEGLRKHEEKEKDAERM